MSCNAEPARARRARQSGALSILARRRYRCALDLSLDAIDVLTGILKSAETGKFVAMQTTCERPSALGPDMAREIQAQHRSQKAVS